VLVFKNKNEFFYSTALAMQSTTTLENEGSPDAEIEPEDAPAFE
jgi:hypothetical protein